MTRTQAEQYIRERYGVMPEYPWSTSPEHAVFRHPENRKWFGIIMQISADKLGLETDIIMDIINVKCDPVLIGSLLGQTGIFPAYHMNKAHWISLALNDSLPEDTLCWLLDMSHAMTAPKPPKTRACTKGRVERIMRMEQIYNTLWAAIRTADDKQPWDEALCEAYRELTEYYDNGLWQADYEADEQGELPSGLKRGVLSQDGVYDLLEAIRKEQTEKE